MATNIFDNGAVYLNRCYSKCHCCGNTATCNQITGPEGYVVVCYRCRMKIMRRLLKFEMQQLDEQAERARKSAGVRVNYGTFA